MIFSKGTTTPTPACEWDLPSRSPEMPEESVWSLQQNRSCEASDRFHGSYLLQLGASQTLRGVEDNRVSQVSSMCSHKVFSIHFGAPALTLFEGSCSLRS